MKPYKLRWGRISLVFIAAALGTMLLISHILFKETSVEIKTNEAAAEAMPAPKPQQINPLLFVATKGAALHKSKEADRESTEERIKRGDVFHQSDVKSSRRVERVPNFPTDNVTVYHNRQLQTYKDGEAVNRYITDKVTYHTTDNAPQADNRYYTVTHFDNGYQTFIQHLYTQLKRNGCTFDSHCKAGNFIHENDGTFGTTLISDAAYQDKEGEPLGTLEAGTTIFFTYEYPPAVGKNDVSLLRFVGHKAPDADSTVFGTAFVEMFTETGDRTFATFADTENH